jgi:hypothetical protein
MILKPNMALPGLTCPKQPTADEVAEATVRILRRVVPVELPGIVSFWRTERRACLRTSQRDEFEVQVAERGCAVGFDLFLRPRDPAAGPGDMGGQRR